jgi:hypothetical protein
MHSADMNFFFHFLDNSNINDLGVPEYYPCAKIQSFFDHANSMFSHLTFLTNNSALLRIQRGEKKKSHTANAVFTQ